MMERFQIASGRFRIAGKNYIEQWEDKEAAVDQAMRHFIKDAPPDAYTRKGVEAVLRGMGLIVDEH